MFQKFVTRYVREVQQDLNCYIALVKVRLRHQPVSDQNRILNQDVLFVCIRACGIQYPVLLLKEYPLIFRLILPHRLKEQVPKSCQQKLSQHQAPLPFAIHQMICCFR